VKCVKESIRDSVSAPIEHPATLAALETELINLITESLWQMERIAELQNKIRAITQSMEQGLATLNIAPLDSSGSLN
jgi:hypothetical protein